MGLKQAFERILRFGKEDGEAVDDHLSIVLLLREPRFPNLDQLRHGANRAFGIGFSGNPASRHSVYTRGVLFTLANVGPHILSFLYMRKPYRDGSEGSREFEHSLTRPDQRQAWAEHKAYMAINYAKGDVDVESRYVVLATLCAELYDDNCLALYLPLDRALVPGTELALSQLKEIRAYKSVDVA